MDLIFDTHALFWLTSNHPKLSKKLVLQLADPATRLFLSAVTLWEYGDLRARKRLPGSIRLDEMLEQFAIELLDFPVSAWFSCERLPLIHSDPIDRMLVAHAIDAKLVLVTADRRMQEYPVQTLW